jgi:hypothetical protein
MVAFVPVLVFASPCATPATVVADGRIVDFDFVAATTSNFYQFTGNAGHSYSVEVRQDYDDVNPDLSVVVSGPGASCPTPAALGGTHVTTDNDPVIAANATRLSFTAAASGTYLIGVTSGASATVGRYISVSVSDTTAYNVRWSTFSGFITQWGFQNTTGADIHGTLITTTVLGGSGTNTISFTVPANSQIFKIIAVAGQDINVGANKAGFAIFTHDGPPAGVLTDAFFINGNASVIVPSVFQPVRQSAH